MKPISTIVLAVLLATGLLIQPSYAKAPIILNPSTIPELITKFSNEYHINGALFLKVAKCESSLSPTAINYNDGGKGKHSVGIMQFQESTFNLWEKKLGEDLDYYSYYDQLKLASYMWSKQQQNQWTCFRILTK